jgi:hypothetical protein
MQAKIFTQIVFTLLALAMAATRFPASGATFHLQDASWAVFFAAGFYLREQWRWAFPALMVEAVAIDYLTTRYLGTSNYCITLAYSFLLPAHACLWLGGSLLRKHLGGTPRDAALLAVSLFGAVSLCYLVSNGSFYWLGGKAAARSWNGWIANFVDWYWLFLRPSLVYVGTVAVLHVIVVQLRAMQAGRAGEKKKF